MGKKILVISPAWLGDIIMSQSLLKTLKQQAPQAIIHVYAPDYAHPILERMSEVDKIISNPFAHGSLLLTKRYEQGKALRSENYDEAYILPNSLKSALVPFFAQIKRRIGMKGESRYILLNHMRKDKKAFPRMVERYVSLAYIDNKDIYNSQTLPKFAYPSLNIEPLTEDCALIKRLNISLKRPLMVVGCGANYGPAKMWPVEYFAQVCNHFIKNGGSVIAPGTNKDTQTIKAIHALIEEDKQEYFYNLAGQTSLTELLDLVALCKVAVCNDSGLMHTVAAANIPQVAIFGSTSTQYTPPLSEKALLLESNEPCHPCFKRTCKFNTYQCLKGLEPQKVITLVESLL